MFRSFEGKRVLLVSSALFASVCYGQAPSAVICYESDSCPHAYKNGKSVEVLQEPEFTILVSMQEHLGLVEAEIGIANNSNTVLDVIPTRIVGNSIQEDRKHPRHATELIQLSPEQLQSRGFSSTSPILFLPPQQQTLTTGQVVVVGPQGHSVYTYTENANTHASPANPELAGLVPALPSINRFELAAANALTANTLNPNEMIHGMIYFKLPPKHTIDAGIQVPLNGKYYEFHFAWPRP
jgi:hypothetical protein